MAKVEGGGRRGGSVPCLGSQQATPNHHLEGLAHIDYIPFHRIHCRVDLGSRVKTCRGDGVVARPEDWVMT